MCTSGWPITLLLFCLFDSATSSSVSMYTPAPPLPSQILPPSPFPAIISSLKSPSQSTPPAFPPSSSNSPETTESSSCSLTISPSTRVVRFGDPVTANCSVSGNAISFLSWQLPLEQPLVTMKTFLVWSVNSTTDWNIEPMCCAMSEMGPGCHLNLSVIVYKPPDSVSISIANHIGPMIEGHQYTLECIVLDVAPVGNATVTFYRGQTELGRLQSNNPEKKPVTEIFTLDIIPSKDDDGVQYWCEAKLDLGAEGPQPPPVVTSQNITAEVHFVPEPLCLPKLQVQEGESLSCEVRGNPKPSVTWFKDGQVVSLPTHSSRQHAGNYTVMIEGLIGQRNFTLEVEVLTGSGTANCFNRHFLLAVLLIQILTCCKT
ncbi:vascular cell adhesion protein 1-like [Thunnus thynnus]|uniref:vascular cell adhesion protein 1-like n=1 Tax=Thunnus thynnus TaxID=8237 RepID=UPI003526FCCF|eukprot:superscaffoldBa00001520_g10927